MTRAAGFAKTEAWKLVEKPQELARCRGFVRGEK